VTQQDEVWAFYWTFPFHPLNRNGSIAVYHVLEPGTAQILRWRENFAARALSVWQAGGDLWISKRAFSTRPRPQWNWAEGADARVSWLDLRDFFSRLETVRSLGDEDGFFLLAPSSKNREILAGVQRR